MSAPGRVVVVSSVGLSPKAVGQGLWALERRWKLRIDRHVRLLTAKAAEMENRRVEECLYLRELPSHPGEDWARKTEPCYLKCDDVTPEQVERVRDLIVEKLRDLRAEEPEATFYFDFTPGRLLVSYFMVLGAQLYARPQDRLVYSLPTAKGGYLLRRWEDDPRSWPEEDDHVELLEIPVMRFRSLPALMHDRLGLSASRGAGALFENLDQGVEMFEHLVLLGLHAHGLHHDAGNLLSRLKAALEEGDTAGALSLVARIQDIQASFSYLAARERLPIRNTAQKRRMEPRDADLRALVETVVEPQRAGGARIVNAVPEDIRIRVREVLLTRLLDNLISNAKRAAGPTGSVRVEAERADGKVILRIADDGPGFPPGVVDTLFDFFKPRTVQDALWSGPDGGLGLGLPIAGRLARELAGPSAGAPIRARNAEGGHGAVVQLELPLTLSE